MVVTNVKATILKFVNKQGVAKKTGKEYNFTKVVIVDEEANVFELNVAPELAKGLVTLLKVKNKEAVLTLSFYPRQINGFASVGGELVDYK